MKKLQKFTTLWNLVKEDKFKLIASAIIIFIAELSTIFTGYLNGAAVEAITKNMLLAAISYLVIYFIIELIVEGALRIFGQAILLKVESSLTRKLGYETYRKALNLPSVAYEDMKSGEIINRITNDADTLSFTFKGLLEMCSYLIGTIIIFIYILFNSLILSAYILVFMTLIILVVKSYTPKMKKAHKERKKHQDRFTSLTTESIRGIREIKTLGIKNNLLKDMKEIISCILNKSYDETDINTRFRMITKTLRAILEVGTFIICIILLYYKSISLTFFIAMTYYVYRFMYLIDSIESLTETYQKVSVSIGRVNEILNNELYEDVKFGNVKLDKIEGVIEFKNVSFSYPKESNTLKKFNLTIEPNKKVAIVGKSGQGKSTLFNLITRIFDVKSGQITIDGINIKDLDEKTLREQISIIRQEPFIFNRSIKDNFKLIDPNIKMSEIKKYAEMAYLDGYIESLPRKYNTILGEGGVNLSGGQKQRLSIARTLAKKSKIVLFDEATSALDNSSQEYIKKSIDNLVKDHTVVIVAHRLSTIIDADIIHVVDDGKIIASGTHKELLKTSKVYKMLYETESLNS